MTYLIMHGSYGSPEENWFPWLKNTLISMNQSVILEQFPSDDWNRINAIGYEKRNTIVPNQSLESWDAYFRENILPRISQTETVYIGHSIAPVFMLRELEKYDFTLKKAIFVAPFFTIPDRKEIWQFYPVNKTFYSSDFNFEIIRNQIRESHVVYGDDDPYVPATEPPLFASRLGSKIHCIYGGKHCGSNFKEFPYLLPLL